MTAWKKYHLAQNVNDALHALTAARGESRLIAGGTDLLLDLQQGRHPPVDTLVDVTQISELNLLEIRPQGLFIGAALPLNRVVRHPLVFEHARALYEAAGLIGGPQVRNTATLGGNVGHALPAGDGTIALLALEARAEVADWKGRRQVPLGDLFLGPGRSALDPCGEILVGFYVPLIRSRQASAFLRVMRPQGVAIAILNMAIWLERRGERIEGIRISVGPAGPVPQRAREAEQSLIGESPGEEVIQRALSALWGETRFRTSPHRATEAYRRHMAGILLKDTLSLAWERAGKNVGELKVGRS